MFLWNHSPFSLFENRTFVSCDLSRVVWHRLVKSLEEFRRVFPSFNLLRVSHWHEISVYWSTPWRSANVGNKWKKTWTLCLLVHSFASRKRIVNVWKHSSWRCVWIFLFFIFCRWETIALSECHSLMKLNYAWSNWWSSESTFLSNDGVAFCIFCIFCVWISCCLLLSFILLFSVVLYSVLLCGVVVLCHGRLLFCIFLFLFCRGFIWMCRDIILWLYRNLFGCVSSFWFFISGLFSSDG